MLTQGRHLHLAPQVDDFPAIESLVGQGVREGVLKPRSRIEIARMAVSGLGASVLRTRHLAGIRGVGGELCRALTVPIDQLRGGLICDLGESALAKYGLEIRGVKQLNQGSPAAARLFARCSRWI